MKINMVDIYERDVVNKISIRLLQDVQTSVPIYDSNVSLGIIITSYVCQATPSAHSYITIPQPNLSW